MTKATLSAVLAFALSYVHAVAPGQENIRITQGQYIYQFPPLQEGKDASGEPLPVAFSAGLLTDGRLKTPGRSVTWPRGANMPGGTMTILFDLRTDRRLERIVFLPGPSGMNWHGMATVAVCYRAEAVAHYRVASYELLWPYGKERTVTVPMHRRKARYVQLRLRKFALNSPGRRKFEPREVVIEAAGPAAAPLKTPDAKALLAEAGREPRVVDRWGQYLYEDWPGKIQSDAQLAAEGQRETKQLAGVSQGPDPKRFDKYGGIRQSPSFRPTGFFQARKVAKRWWLITPEGNRFFMVGIDRMWPIVRCRMVDKGGRPREIFSTLPDRTQFKASDFSPPPGQADFLQANLRVKYGPDYRRRWFDVMARRLSDWGFNAGPRWWRSGKSDPLRLPYTEVIWLWDTWGKAAPGRIGRAGGGGCIDPFDPSFAADLESKQKQWLIRNRDNPWIVGYVFENENGWKPGTLGLVLGRKSDCAAKRAFVEFIRKRHADDLSKVNRMLATDARSFAELTDRPIDLAKVPAKDKSGFLRLASRRYHKTLRDFIRRHDSNHLFLGSALSTVGCEEWVAGGIEFLDGMTFNSYSDDPTLHDRLDKYDKPRIITEMGFAVFGRGLGGWGLSKNHKARGRKYRYLVEHWAASPCTVGFGWFQCFDNFPDFATGGGENYNLGLLNICDQPYWDAIGQIRKANRRLYDIRAGKVAPVTRQELEAASK